MQFNTALAFGSFSGAQRDVPGWEVANHGDVANDDVTSAATTMVIRRVHGDGGAASIAYKWGPVP
jgi:acyl CoA:acetate/3-ketoacid CoA transferase beta subunit